MISNDIVYFGLYKNPRIRAPTMYNRGHRRYKPIKSSKLCWNHELVVMDKMTKNMELKHGGTLGTILEGAC